MQYASPPIRLLALDDLKDFDAVEPDEIEVCRRAFACTPAEFAEHLGWSQRKYQRTLEAAREVHFVDRDVALAVRGLMDVWLDTEDTATTVDAQVPAAPRKSQDAKAFCGGRTFPDILPSVLDGGGVWTADVTPHLLRLVAERAMRGKRITYGEAATTLEEAGLTHRVWPRTLYGMPLGAICNTMMRLGEATKIRIPLLSTIVIKGSGQPGTGVDPLVREFIKQYERPNESKELMARLRRDRIGLINELQQEVFAFPHWPGVLRALGLDATQASK